MPLVGWLLPNGLGKLGNNDVGPLAFGMGKGPGWLDADGGNNRLFRALPFWKELLLPSDPC